MLNGDLAKGTGEFMTEKDFDSLWTNVALIEIGKAIDSCKKKGIKLTQREDGDSFKKNTHSRYEIERSNFRNNAKIKKDDLLDRHKVAALFYIAFVDKVDGYSFAAYYGKIKVDELGAIMTHDIAFKISLGIMESFIASDVKIDSKYKEFVEKNGLMKIDLICFKPQDNTSYKEEVLKLFIYAQKENKLSVGELAVIFSLIENNTRLHYKLSQSC
jgi:hypothetical protein